MENITKTFTYAGIGSRETPANILSLMTRIAGKLETLGYHLHSGGADCADTAFEQGVVSESAKTIFLPWAGFNGRIGSSVIPPRAFDLARQFHPAPERLSQGALKLMARNSQQVLGADCQTPVDFIICWHNGTGGTTQACRIAEHFGIPVINLIDKNWPNKIRAVVKGELK